MIAKLVPSALPPGPLDATLALAVLAPRRARRVRRHLLASAPLLGSPARRLTRARLPLGAAGRALAWRAVHQPGGGATPTERPAPTAPHDGRLVQVVRVVSRPVSASAVAPPPSSPARATEGSGPPPVPARATWSAPLPPPAFPAAPGAADLGPDPREFAAAPGLVWFARWRDLRVHRTVHEQRTALLVATDGVRRVPRPAQTGPSGTPALARAVSAPLSTELHGAPAPLAAPSDPGTPQADTSPRGPASADDSHDRAAAAPAPGGDVPSRRGRERASATAWRRAPGLLSQLLSPSRARARALPLGAQGVPVLDPGRSSGTPQRQWSARGGLPDRAPAARALGVMTQSLRRDVAEEIRAEVGRAVETAASRAAVLASRAPAATAAAPPSPLARVDDRLAAALLDRMRLLQREERFRRGQRR